MQDTNNLAVPGANSVIRVDSSLSCLTMMLSGRKRASMVPDDWGVRTGRWMRDNLNYFGSISRSQISHLVYVW